MLKTEQRQTDRACPVHHHPCSSLPFRLATRALGRECQNSSCITNRPPSLASNPPIFRPRPAHCRVHISRDKPPAISPSSVPLSRAPADSCRLGQAASSWARVTLRRACSGRTPPVEPYQSPSSPPSVLRPRLFSSITILRPSKPIRAQLVLPCSTAPVTPRTVGCSTATMATRYTADDLLRLRKSSLCVKPPGLPPSEEWMG